MTMPGIFPNYDRDVATSPFQYQPQLLYLEKPYQAAFTESSLVKTHSDAFAVALRRLYEEQMEVETSQSLQRSSSHQSHSSNRSQQSQPSRTVRGKARKLASYASSTTSSLTPSDKSLTSFPSFSPETPKDNRSFSSFDVYGADHLQHQLSSGSLSLVDGLTAASPSQHARNALFDDSPLGNQQFPGVINNASDDHIERLIARNGAVALVRQIAEDLAQRDSQMAALQRRAEERERALRKIILECGLSNLDLEKRLRLVEETSKQATGSFVSGDSSPPGIEDLLKDAISLPLDRAPPEGDATVRASELLRAAQMGRRIKEPVKGWKDYIWGGTGRNTSRAVSVTNVAVDQSAESSKKTSARPTVLENGFFKPPEETNGSRNRVPSVQSSTAPPDRKAPSSLAALALRLVAGNSNINREDNPGIQRGRATSDTARQNGRNPSSASTRTSFSTQSAQTKTIPKDTGTQRRKTLALNVISGPNRTTSERWDTMGASPQNTTLTSTENYGPVEMDSIIPFEAQPPTLTQSYHNRPDAEFLTDRFGFIYDQRRKKRQREAAEAMQKTKRRSRVEMLSSARGGMSPGEEGQTVNVEDLEGRPDTPASDDHGEDGHPVKRWQDYLRIATFPTELLSHTPSGGVRPMEILEGDSGPSSPGIIPEERGFIPTASTTAATAPPAADYVDHATISKPASTSATATLAKEDVEPVKLLLEQLSDVHDSLQRDKTVKWNDFLRKVRAERKRDGEAAAAALATDDKRVAVMLPEASLTDGEMIGITGLGNKGKAGRAKWNEFKTLVLGGIPVAYRAKVWAECSGAAALRIPGYYDDLVAQKDGNDDPAIVAQIEMDINRTLTDNIFFRRGPGVSKLNEVLLAYSRRNTEVGYCQGMNLITACLLLIMPAAEDAFWVLTSIIENILPRGYYDHSLLASRADQQVLRQYVADILPKLSSYLDELGIELEALTFQWFLSVFTDCLSAEALFRVWDVVFCTNDGSTFLFQVALALLKLNERQLLQCDTPAAVYTYINHQMTNHAISIDGLIHASEGLRKVVRREDIESRRKKAIEAERALIRQREAKNRLRKAERLAANGKAAEGKVTEKKIMERKAAERRVTDSPKSPRSGEQLELSSDEYGALTIRTPMPIDEEASLGLG